MPTFQGEVKLVNLFAELSCSLGNCHSAATLLARPFSEPTATSRSLTDDIICHVFAALCVKAVAVVIVNGVSSLSLQKLQCKDENKCSLNLRIKIAKTCSWTVREAPPSVIASASWFEPAFGAGSRRCGGRAVKEKVAVSGVETSEGPERKRTNHRGGFAAQPPLFPPPPPSGRGCRIRHSEAGADAVKLAQPSL